MTLIVCCICTRFIGTTGSDIGMGSDIDMNSILLSPCFHRFCNSCFEEWKKNCEYHHRELHCPYDNIQLFEKTFRNNPQMVFQNANNYANYSTQNDVNDLEQTMDSLNL